MNVTLIYIIVALWGIAMIYLGVFYFSTFNARKIVKKAIKQCREENPEEDWSIEPWVIDYLTDEVKKELEAEVTNDGK